MTPDRVEGLRVEFAAAPLGIDEPAPRLSWVLRSERAGARQAAARVVVSSEPGADAVPDVWDSGRREGGESHLVPYLGPALRSGQRCHWRVHVWDERGTEIVSDAAVWEMGLLRPDDWHGAETIGLTRPAYRHDDHRPSPYLRTGFDLPTTEQLVRARLHVTAAGMYAASLNGTRVGSDELRPGWTDYRVRLPYQTYDVTDAIGPGRNVLGAVLGDGWYAGYIGWERRREVYGAAPGLRAVLILELADGSTRHVITDASWEATWGPILASDRYMGETYDARRAVAWDAPRGTAGWRPAEVMDPAGARLVAAACPPVRVTEELPPVAVEVTETGAVRVDFGQNLAGWARLRLRGRRGQIVQVRHAEMVGQDGALYVDNQVLARNVDTVVLDSGELVWSPTFAHRGFRYLELEGLAGADELVEAVACAVHTDLERIGRFASSNELLDRVYESIVWTQRSNYVEVPSDCPQRDERIAFLGDAQAFAATGALTFDCAAFLSKWMDDIADAQAPDGTFPPNAPIYPELPRELGLGTPLVAGVRPGWADGGVVIPWTVYEHYGDRRILERHLERMVAWVDRSRSLAPDGIWRPEDHWGFGDWLQLGPRTPGDLFATAWLARSLELTAAAAAAVEEEATSARLRAERETVSAAFAREFLDADTGLLCTETQGGYALALSFGLVPEGVRRAAQERLVELVAADGGFRTGIHATRYLLPALQEAGAVELAYDLLLSDAYPSLGWMVRNGATTVWERWDGIDPDGVLYDATSNSFNHFALAAVGEWLYAGVLGLSPAAPGWRRARIAPAVSPRLIHAAGSVQTPYGTISSSWRASAGGLECTVLVPPGIEATFVPPGCGDDDAHELASGTHRFTVDAPGGDGPAAVRRAGSR